MMPETAISDQKRLVRGEHYKHARKFLRTRDEVHQAKWRIMTVAGPSPREEIACIRALFSNAFIVSVDNEPTNTMAAHAAGADDVYVGDLGNYVMGGEKYAKYKKPPAFLTNERFDVICLDLSGPATSALRTMVGVYWQYLLTARGVMIVTLSYGRDVTEMYETEWEAATAPRGDLHRGVKLLQNVKEMTDPIRARLYFTFFSKAACLRSVMQYAGRQMPMLSALLVKDNGAKSPFISFVKLTDQDYELVVTDDDRSAVYACPQDRFEALRRSHIARKAIHTRQMRQEVERMTVDVAIDVAASHDNGVSRRSWARWEEAVLKESADTKTPEEIAKIVNRSEGAVRARASALGIVFRASS